MILNKRQAKKLGMNNTIDLKYIMAREYCDKVELSTLKDKIIDKVYIILFYIWIISTLWLVLGMITPQITFGADIAQNNEIRDEIRQERLEICQKAYKNTQINEMFIYEQLPAVRCATYMSLVYAYESNFGKSRKCVEDKNCHGMKWNWVDTPAWFLKFKTHKEGREYFAKKYFRWHYKKDITTFVYNWSMTDRSTYIAFMKKRYWKMYNELEYLYMTGRSPQ